MTLTAGSVNSSSKYFASEAHKVQQIQVIIIIFLNLSGFINISVEKKIEFLEIIQQFRLYGVKTHLYRKAF